MLASGAHVSIGPSGTEKEYLLDLTRGSRAYRHFWDSLVPANAVVIPGRPGRENVQPDVKFWAYDDWSGGEGIKAYDAETPYVYWQGRCNPRRPGQLAPPPTDTQSTMTADNASSTEAAKFVILGGRLYAWQYRKGHYTTDLVTWTDSTVTGLPASHIIDQVTSDQQHIYAATDDGTNKGISRVAIGDAAWTTFSTAVAGVTAKGLANLNGKLYEWGGFRLREYDTTATPPTAGTLVFSVGNSVDPSYGGCVATDNSIVMFSANESQTRVYEYKSAAGALLWRPPSGFTAKAMCYSLGVIYLAGDFNGKAALFAMNLEYKNKLFLGYFRYGISTFTPTWCAEGPGAQILVGMSTGEVFVFDAEQTAISLLDVRTGAGTLVDGISYKDKRAGLFNDGTTTFRTSAWSSDDNVSTSTAGTFESSVWDLGIPEQTKILETIEIAHSDLAGSPSIDVAFALDDLTDAPTYTTTDKDGAAMTATTGTSTTFTVSGNALTRSFKNLRFKATLNSGAILSSITVWCRIKDKVQKWELALRIKKEPPGVAGRQAEPNVLLSNLKTPIDNGDVVRFKDGWDERKNNSTSYDVVIEACDFIADENKPLPGEGTAFVRLRKVP